MEHSKRRPKIVDVARAAGVSPTTVSHSLNGRGNIGEKTRQRIIKLAHEMGYRPHLGARRLRTGAAQQIALISSMPFSVAGGLSRLGFFMEAAAAAAEKSLSSGYALVLVPPVESLPSLDDIDMAGAIVVEPERDDPVTEQLQERNIPVVSISAQPGAEDKVPYVDLQNHTSCKLLLQHLVDQGCKNIALICGDKDRDWYLKAIEEYRVLTQQNNLPNRLLLVDETTGIEGAKSQVLKLLNEYPDTDAICAVIDSFASGAVEAIKEQGLNVPNQIKLATRYDGPRTHATTPAMTAINIHLADAANKAVELLLAMIKDQKHAYPVRGKTPVLIPRGSSGA